MANIIAGKEDELKPADNSGALSQPERINSYCARFISEFGCEEYFKHNKDLLFYERQRELITQIENLGL